MANQFEVIVTKGEDAAQRMAASMDQWLSIGYIPLGGVSVAVTAGNSIVLAQSFVRATSGGYKGAAIDLMRRSA